MIAHKLNALSQITTEIGNVDGGILKKADTDRHSRADTKTCLATRWILAGALLVSVFLILGVRAARLINEPGNPQFHQWVMQDFRDEVYYPVVSFLNGGVPYDANAQLTRYPQKQKFQLYSPLHLLVHTPFGLMPHGPSQLLFLAFTAALGVTLAWVVLRMCGQAPSVLQVVVLSTLILASRPGHWNLLLGQTTLELVLAVYIALYFGSRSVAISGSALALATMKQTFGLPLLFLMLAERYYKAIVIGLVLAAVATLIPTVILIHSAGGVQPLAAAMHETYLDFGRSPGNSPMLCPVRLDGAAFVSRLLGRNFGLPLDLLVLAASLGFAGSSMRRIRRIASGREADLFCMAIGSLAILISTYHQSYCALLLVLPLTALVLDRWAPVELGVTQRSRYLLAVLLSIPAVNYFATWTVANSFEAGSFIWVLVVSVNGAAIVAAFAVYVALAYRAQGDQGGRT